MRKPYVRVTLSATDLDERFSRNVSVSEVAAELGCTERAVRAFAVRHGVALPSERRPRPVRNARTPAVRQRRFPQLEDVDWLTARLRQASARQVAREVGCAEATVRRAADRHGIVRGRSFHRVEFPELHDEEALRRLTDRGLDARGIAEVIGCSRQTAGEALRRHGIYTRPRRPSPPARRLEADWRLFHNVATVARLHGVTPKTARRWLVDAGLLSDERLR